MKRNKRTAVALMLLIQGIMLALIGVVAWIVWVRTESLPLVLASVGVCALVLLIGGLIGVVALGGSDGLALVRGKGPLSGEGDDHPRD